MRWAAAVPVLLLVVLTGCTPDPDPATGSGADVQEVTVEGVIVEVTASAGDPFFVIEVAEQGMLPLETTERPPRDAGSVTVEVPSTLEVPADAAGEFAALDAYVQQTGVSLVVVRFG